MVGLLPWDSVRVPFPSPNAGGLRGRDRDTERDRWTEIQWDRYRKTTRNSTTIRPEDQPQGAARGATLGKARYTSLILRSMKDWSEI